MNKDNFMKAMSMIDEDLIKEADTTNEAVAETEKAGAFFSEKEQSSSVSGVDVYHRTIWKKFLGIAAAFVLVAGAIGGGVYYFSQLKNNDNKIIENETQYDTIYDKLKANKDKYEMSSVVCVYDSTVLGFPHDEEKKENFFEYMDKFDMTEEIEETDISKTVRHLRFNFLTDDKIVFTFEIYENGDCSWTEKDKDNEKTTYHRLTDGKEIFNYFVKSYDVKSCQPLNWDDVDSGEIKAFMDECYTASMTDSNVQPNTAVVHNVSETKTYEIKDRDEIRRAILNSQWIRANEDEFDHTKYADMYGMKINEDGYIAGYYNGCNVVYRIEKYALLDEFNTLWQSLDGYQLNTSESEYVNPLIIKDIFKDARSAKYYYASLACGYTAYKITDPEKFSDEVASLSWIKWPADKCEWGPAVSDWSELWTDEGGYIIGDTAVGLKGYLSRAFTAQGDNYYYCKLEKEEDVAKFNQILENYISPNKYSEIYLNSTNEYSNLRAHYTYDFSYGDGSYDEHLKGLYIEDKVNKRIYATGEGKKPYNCGKVQFNGMIEMEVTEDRGRDDLVFKHGRCLDTEFGFFKVKNKDTGELLDVVGYDDGGNIRMNLEPILYGTRSFVGGFGSYDVSGEMIDINGYGLFLKELAFDVSNKDGKREYHIITQDGNGSEKETWLVLTENWQLISYEEIYTNTDGFKSRTLFRLDDYEFDSPDFTMEDVMPEFEKLEKEYKETHKD